MSCIRCNLSQILACYILPILICYGSLNKNVSAGISCYCINCIYTQGTLHFAMNSALKWGNSYAS